MTMSRCRGGKLVIIKILLDKTDIISKILFVCLNSSKNKNIHKLVIIKMKTPRENHSDRLLLNLDRDIHAQQNIFRRKQFLV